MQYLLNLAIKKLLTLGSKRFSYNLTDRLSILPTRDQMRMTIVRQNADEATCRSLARLDC